MHLLSVRCAQTVALSQNGAFIALLKPEEEQTLPLARQETVLFFYPTDPRFLPGCLFLSESAGVWTLSPGGGRLCRWREDLYELTLLPAPGPTAPVPLMRKEERWGAFYAGLCGDRFVLEAPPGRFTVCDETGILDFSLLSPQFALLSGKDFLLAVDSQLHTVLPKTPGGRLIRDGGALTLEFPVMDLFRARQTLDPATLRPAHVTLLHDAPQTNEEMLRCFCQAVRLGDDATAEGWMTEDLRRSMSVEDVRRFFGAFDAVEELRFSTRQSDRALALRYVVDDWNFHYICYEFTLVNTSGAVLIDDIAQL